MIEMSTYSDSNQVLYVKMQRQTSKLQSMLPLAHPEDRDEFQAKVEHSMLAAFRDRKATQVSAADEDHPHLKRLASAPIPSTSGHAKCVHALQTVLAVVPWSRKPRRPLTISE